MSTRPVSRRRPWPTALLVLAGAALLGGHLVWRATPPAPLLSGQPYAADSPRQRLDLYLPRGGGPGPYPLVVWIHGGGWSSGGRELRVFAEPLWVLDHGYALASIGYRLSDEARFPAQLQDARAAVRWLRANGAAYGLDPARVGVWGASAGGHLAALLATAGAAADLDPAGPAGPVDAGRVQAALAWYPPAALGALDADAAAVGCPVPAPVTGSAELLLGGPLAGRADAVRAADPASHASPASAPLLLQHGTRDCEVPYLQSQRLYEAMLPIVGPERVALDLVSAGHGDLPLPWAPFSGWANRARVIAFFDAHLKPRP